MHSYFQFGCKCIDGGLHRDQDKYTFEQCTWKLEEMRCGCTVIIKEDKTKENEDV